MTDTRQRVAAMVLALLMASSVLAGLPIAGADSPESEIDRQNPANVTIADRLQSAEGEITVVARLETPAPRPSRDGLSAKQRLKSHAETSQSDLVTFADRAGGVEVVQRFWLGNAVLLEVNTSRTGLMEVASIQGVERLHPNYEFEVPESTGGTGLPSSETSDTVDSDAAYTYGLEQLNVPDVWQDFETKGDGTKVAVLDTGVQANHPAIALHTRDESDPTYPGGWAEFDEDGNPVSGSTPHDTGWHGTHTSGTVAGQNVSGVPAFGVAPNAKLMHGLVLSDGNGTVAQILGGMQWAVEEDADVISMSLGTLLDPNSNVDLPISSYFIDPIRDARAAGTYVVVSSGNEGDETITTPGGIYDATSIGASDDKGEIATFSSGGVVDPTEVWKDPQSEWPSEYIYPDVSAPGVSILSSIPEDGDSSYGYASGTSMAAPHVAGVVALLHSAADDRPSPGEIDTALAETATKPADAPSSKDTRYGEGIVDAYGAASEVANASISTVSVSVSPSQNEMAEDETRAYHIVVQDVDAGVGSYDFTFSLSNATVGSITDVSLGGNPGQSTVDSAGDDSSVTVDAEQADTADTGDVTIATVTVRGDVAGSSSLDLSVHSIADETGTAYAVSDVFHGALTVLDPAKFELSGLAPGNYSAKADEVVNVSATVENVGDVAGSQTVELRVDDGETVETLGTTTVDLDAGERMAIDFDLDAGQLAGGEYTYSVWTADAERSASLTVAEAPATFAVTGLNPDVATVEQFEVFTVTGTVENVGDLSGEKTVELRVAGLTIDTHTRALDGGNSTTVKFLVDASRFDVGVYNYSVWTEDDAANGTLTVEETSIAYESGNVTSSVINEDDEAIVACVYVSEIVDEHNDVRYEIDPVDPEERNEFTVRAVDLNFGADIETVTLDADALRQFEFQNFSMDAGRPAGQGAFQLLSAESSDWVVLDPVPALEEEQVSIRMTGIQRVTGESGTTGMTRVGVNRTRTASIVIETKPIEDARFSVSGLDQETYTVEANESVTVLANVTNTGDIADEKVVEFRLDDGEALPKVGDTTVSLDGGNSTIVEFQVDAGLYEVGTNNYSVWTEDDQAEGRLIVKGSADEWWGPYVNESDVVEARGLNAAVGEFLTGDLDSNRLNAIIRSYLGGDPM